MITGIWQAYQAEIRKYIYSFDSTLYTGNCNILQH